jgi:DME family drug/metabolite transporter
VGLLLVFLAGIIWGTIGPAVQLVHDDSGLSPLATSAYRAIAAVAVLVLASAVTGRLQRTWSVARHHWLRVLVVGLLIAASQLLFFIAVVAAGVSVATVVCLGLPPVLLLVLGAVRRRRLPPVGRIIVVVVAVVGLLLVSIAGGVHQAPDPGPGVLAALAAGAAYALCTVIAAPLSARLDTFTLTVATICVVGAALVPVGLVAAHLRGEAITTSSTLSWSLIVYLGLVTMAVAYALLYTGLRSTPSGTAVIATLVEPVTAVLIAVLLLGERLSPAGLIGSLLIVGAIAGLGRNRERATTAVGRPPRRPARRRGGRALARP